MNFFSHCLSGLYVPRFVFITVTSWWNCKNHAPFTSWFYFCSIGPFHSFIYLFVCFLFKFLHSLFVRIATLFFKWQLRDVNFGYNFTTMFLSFSELIPVSIAFVIYLFIYLFILHCCLGTNASMFIIFNAISKMCEHFMTTSY